MTKPKHAVANHFQNDFDTLPTIRRVCAHGWRCQSGGLSNAPFHEKNIEAGGERYQTPDSMLVGWPEELDGVADNIYANLNKEQETDFKLQLKK